jgi:tRNA(Ile)-lysidine synthase
VPAGQLLRDFRSELASVKTLYIAFSGGLDSTVLLAAAHRELGHPNLQAIHVNHGLSPHSNRWQDHCQQVCFALGVPLQICEVDVASTGRGVEKAARDARYGCFERLLGPDDLLLMAHHLDDQVETALFRFLRGSGPGGVSGMPATRALGRGRLLRPFLGLRREILAAYADDLALQWVEDESNVSLTMDRNYLRNKLLPLIEDRWPDYRQKISRSAGHCQSADNLLQEVGNSDLDALGERGERFGRSVAIAGFAELSRDRQENLLRCWIQRCKLAPCGHKVIDGVVGDLVPARQDANPCVSWVGGVFRRFRNRLFLLPSVAPVTPTGPLDLELPAAVSPFNCDIGGGHRLYFKPVQAAGALRLTSRNRITISTRQGGERCRPARRGCSAPLKKLLLEYGLEPWLRDSAPLIYVDGDLAAVADLFVCEQYSCAPDELGYAVSWYCEGDFWEEGF